MAQRHGGIVTLGVLGIVFGLIGLFYNGFLVSWIVLMKQSSGQMDPATVETLKAFSKPVIASMGVNALTGLIMLVAGIGLCLLRSWARVGYGMASAMTVANRLLTFPMHFSQSAAQPGGPETAQAVGVRAGGIMGDFGVIFFNLFALWFLNRAVIKAQLQPGSPSQPS